MEASSLFDSACCFAKPDTTSVTFSPARTLRLSEWALTSPVTGISTSTTAYGSRPSSRARRVVSRTSWDSWSAGRELVLQKRPAASAIASPWKSLNTSVSPTGSSMTGTRPCISILLLTCAARDCACPSLSPCCWTKSWTTSCWVSPSKRCRASVLPEGTVTLRARMGTTRSFFSAPTTCRVISSSHSSFVTPAERPCLNTFSRMSSPW
mmetsp:Transcript_25166/g.70344  ORF Transcript_25166/g.70344 Transcript_25166/m.70344 type:complete len:209 (+) Transcript_25166:1977-2603(+)